MKIKLYPLIYPLLLTCVFLVFATSCGKDDPASPRSGNCTNGKTTAVFSPAVIYGSMTDQDGNVYKTVTIGTQTWMAENLRTTKYRDGSDIPLVYLNNEWGPLTTGAYCNYETTTNCDTIATFGRLYNWYAATDVRNIAPPGWHVPTTAEWGKISVNESSWHSETGTTHWLPAKTVGTNTTGFTALPAGNRGSGGLYYDIGQSANWWTTSTWLPLQKAKASMIKNNKFYSNDEGDFNEGKSIRCVKD